MKRLPFLVLMLSFLFTAKPVVGQTIIYDNGDPDGYTTNISDFGENKQAGDDFLLNQGQNIVTDIHWWGAYSNNMAPTLDDFTIRIFEFDAEFDPAEDYLRQIIIADASRYDTGQDIADIDLYGYSINIEPIELEAEKTYLLSIVYNGSLADACWVWAVSAPGRRSYDRASDLADWEDNWLGDFAFQLTGPAGPVPEPATILLIGTGLVGLAAFGRRFKKS